MSGISGKKLYFIESIAEKVGYKTGLALSIDDLRSFIPEDYIFLLNGDLNAYTRIRAEEYEVILATLLYRLGKISSGDITNFVIILLQKYKYSGEFIYAMVTLYSAFSTEFPIKTSRIPMPVALAGKDPYCVIQHIAATIYTFIQKSIDDKSYEQRKTLWLSMLNNKTCSIPDELIKDIILAQNDYIIRSPWLDVRTTVWQDLRHISELFDSEQIASLHGRFFDQRFVDFLSANMEELKRINWRQFEGLTAEYLHREGYVVEIGEGRNDDGVDIRAWSDSDDTTPQLLIQCKRQKDKVGKTIVKSLWADIEYEHAENGLIVTTSELSPGARNTINIRNYPIIECNFNDLKEWLLKMRTPWTGIFFPDLWNK